MKQGQVRVLPNGDRWVVAYNGVHYSQHTTQADAIIAGRRLPRHLVLSCLFTAQMDKFETVILTEMIHFRREADL